MKILIDIIIIPFPAPKLTASSTCSGVTTTPTPLAASNAATFTESSMCDKRYSILAIKSQDLAQYHSIQQPSGLE